MRYIEEGLLKDNILKINNINTLDAFFNKTSKIKLSSIQESNVELDLEVIDEIKKILDVIISIIYKPQISNKSIDSIIPSVQAYELKPEDYRLTTKDPSLWKKHNSKMIPNEVHYHTYDDEIVIYENIFIVELVNKIEYKIKEYYLYYKETIDLYNFNKIKLDNKLILCVLSSLDNINNKIKRITNSRFYLIINESRNNLIDLKLSNIILNNSLYNRCYKFYLKYFKTKIIDLKKDYFLYNYFNLLKVLNNKGFKIKTKYKKSSINSDVSLYNNLFTIDINIDKEYNYLIIDITNKRIRQKSHNVLYLESIYKDINIPSSYDSIFKLDTWKLKEYKDDNFISINDEVKSNYELIEIYLNNKLQLIKSDIIYNKFCPCCSSRSLEQQNNLLLCLDCNSLYSVFKYKKVNYLWFIRSRRD